MTPTAFAPTNQRSSSSAGAEDAFFFKSHGVRLFGVLHTPKQAAASRSIVFCHPYGEEKQLSYRVLVRFARKLCEAGYAVFRFDGRGYGDSEGSFENATVETLVEDSVSAIDVIRQRTGTDHIDLLGLRLGAMVASLATERAPIEQLILWSPIVNGARYLDELIKKLALRDVAAGVKPLSKDAFMRRLKSDGAIILDGNKLTGAMAEQLAGTDLTSGLSSFQGAALLLGRPEEQRRLDPWATTLRAGGISCDVGVAAVDAVWDFPALWRWSFPEEYFEQTLRWLKRK